MQYINCQCSNIGIVIVFRYSFVLLFVGDIRYDVHCRRKPHLCSQGHTENEIGLLLLHAPEWEMEGKQNGVSTQSCTMHRTVHVQ